MKMWTREPEGLLLPRGTLDEIEKQCAIVTPVRFHHHLSRRSERGNGLTPGILFFMTGSRLPVSVHFRLAAGECRESILEN
jgi:hypothetical protein